jgi:cell wall-associated NlpC family hydrolase
MPRTWGSLTTAAGALGLLLAPVAVRADPAAPTVHIVEAGETLSQIALDVGQDVATLAALNGLNDPNFLVVGQSLKLPATALRAAPASAPAPKPGPAPPAAPASPRSYTVVDGDTLWAIANQFATTADALAQLNKLDDPNRLAVGAVLAVPGGEAGVASPPMAPAPAPKPAPATPAGTVANRSVLVSYTVQAGETLNQIARQFDVRPDAIAQASALDDPNRLSTGGVLKVPLPSKEHMVSAGETLRDIALAEKVDLGSLIDFNQLDDPELIRVGQVLLLPIATQQAAAISARPTASSSAAAAISPGASTPASAAASTGPTLTLGSASPVSPRPVAKLTPAKPAAARPAAPVAVVAPPRGAPADGLAGAGLKLLGAPYVWGGSAPSGFDCSGFLWYVSRQIGKPLSRGLFGQYNSGSHPSRDDLKAGDLVFFQNTYSPGLSHNGIYIGNGQFVHAADGFVGVTISSLNTAFWSSHWFGATRLP